MDVLFHTLETTAALLMHRENHRRKRYSEKRHYYTKQSAFLVNVTAAKTPPCSKTWEQFSNVNSYFTRFHLQYLSYCYKLPFCFIASFNLSVLLLMRHFLTAEGTQLQDLEEQQLVSSRSNSQRQGTPTQIEK